MVNTITTMKVTKETRNRLEKLKEGEDTFNKVLEKLLEERLKGEVKAK